MDNTTAYRHNQDRQPPKNPSAAQQAADRNPDDYGPDAEDVAAINPASGVEYGEVDSASRYRPR